MDYSIVKDVMLASGLTVEGVIDKIKETLPWVNEKWFISRVYEPVATAKSIPYTQVTAAQWDVIFDAIGASESARAEVKATIKALKATMVASKGELDAEGLEAAYAEVYNNRAELAQKYAEEAAQKAEAKAAKAAKKKVAEMSAEEFEASLGLNEVAESANSAEEDLMAALQNM